MRTDERYELELPDRLADLAMGSRPDYLDDVLHRSARTRQRPAWTFPERWLLMDIVTPHRVTVPGPSLRTLGVLALVGLVVAAVIAAYAGSAARLPDPFGVARNGQVAFARGGDLFVIDGATSAARLLVGGPSNDQMPTFSRQGDRLAFVREEAPDQFDLIVSRADGSDPRQVGGPFHNMGSLDWSPDGTTIALASDILTTRKISLVKTDGSGTKTLDLPAYADGPMWRPPDGRQILFRGEAAGTGMAGLYLLDADGSNLRRLDLPFSSQPDLQPWDFQSPEWSPDGTRLLYHRLHTFAPGVAADDNGFRIHVVKVDPAGLVLDDTKLEFDPQADDEAWASWSPDGTKLLFMRIEDRVLQLEVGPVAGGPAVPTGPTETAEQGFGAAWAPDGSRALLSYLGSENSFVVDPAGGPASAIPLGDLDPASWQRIAR